MRNKEWWIARFEEAIDDLKHGYYIYHRGLKNEVDYWRKQIRLVKEFVPRKEGQADGYKIADRSHKKIRQGKHDCRDIAAEQEDGC